MGVKTYKVAASNVLQVRLDYGCPDVQNGRFKRTSNTFEKYTPYLYSAIGVGLCCSIVLSVVAALHGGRQDGKWSAYR